MSDTSSWFYLALDKENYQLLVAAIHHDQKACEQNASERFPDLPLFGYGTIFGIENNVLNLKGWLRENGIPASEHDDIVRAIGRSMREILAPCPACRARKERGNEPRQRCLRFTGRNRKRFRDAIYEQAQTLAAGDRCESIEAHHIYSAAWGVVESRMDDIVEPT